MCEICSKLTIKKNFGKTIYENVPGTFLQFCTRDTKFAEKCLGFLASRIGFLWTL